MKEAFDIMVCTDCGLYIANGDVEGTDKSWKPENIEQRWGKNYNLVSDDSEKDNEFSWQPCEACEACGSRLGGSRMHCVAITV